jgi:hypothetical protein
VTNSSRYSFKVLFSTCCSVSPSSGRLLAFWVQPGQCLTVSAARRCRLCEGAVIRSWHRLSGRLATVGCSCARLRRIPLQPLLANDAFIMLLGRDNVQADVSKTHFPHELRPSHRGHFGFCFLQIACVSAPGGLIIEPASCSCDAAGVWAS